MSEWDKLWDEFGSDPMRSIKDHIWRTIHLAKIKVEGDKLQNLNHRLAQSTIVYEQKVMIANQKLQDAESWTEKGFVVIYKEKLDELKEKAEKWDRLVAEDPDASIILGDQLMMACEELDELRTKLEAIRTLANLSKPDALVKILEVLGE